MMRRIIPLLVIVAIGCGRSTEALPVVQAKGQPVLEAKRNNPERDKGSVLGSSVPSVPANAKRKQANEVAAHDQEPKKAGKDEGFSLPKDKGGKLVGDLLRPANKSLADEPGRKRLSGPAFLERPEITAPAYNTLPPKVIVKDRGKPVRPKPAAEEIPLSRFYGDPQLPVVVKLEGTALVKWSSPDPNEPVPLPILAQPKSDRAPLTDPTADASTDAALSGVIPVRDNPAPFLRTNLPDPFENRQTIKVRNPLPEDPTPQSR